MSIAWGLPLGFFIAILAIFGVSVALIYERRISRQQAQALLELRENHDEIIKRTNEQSDKLLCSLRESEERLRMTLRCAPDIVFIVDQLGRFAFVNDFTIESLGYTRHELMRMEIFDLSPAARRETCHDIFNLICRDTARHTHEILLVAKSGLEIPLELNAVKLPNGRVYASCRDITIRKAARQEITQINHRLSGLIESIPDGIIFKDGDGRWLIINETAKSIYNLYDIEWRGKTEVQLAVLQPELCDEYQACRTEDEQVWQSGKMQVFQKHLTLNDGNQCYFEVRKMPIFQPDGSRGGLVITARDVTDQKRIEIEQEAASAQIHQLAFYDSLTGLPNRRLLMDRLLQACLASSRSGRHGALMVIDLDHFKNLNDSQGHDIGDMLLLEIAKRLSGCVRDGDTVARLGGDEFVVLLQNLSAHSDESASRAEAIAEKIRGAMTAPCTLNEHVYTTTMSIGIMLFKDQQDSIDHLLKHADIAMYQAKAAGRNTIRFYDPVMQAAQEERIKWEAELRFAVERNQLQLHYQVQVDSQYQPVGAEVLLRWLHPQHGMISPAFFIPTAEETGLIVSIGTWVLQNACAQLKAWQNNYLTSKLTLAVNVSARQFRQADFVAEVKRALLQTGARPTLLKLELTESIVLENVEDAISRMNELKALGVSCSLDDFGTGYSSLQYLKRLPLDQIKIDQTFVRDIASDANDATIVKTIIVMAKALGLHVIAEGVEMDAQLTFLELCGCETFQGYLFSKPVSLDKFETLLRASTNQLGFTRKSKALPCTASH
ncbi:MAG: EAL domain-containing protein [Gallionella sp.]|nr:EAL domain-containing protein [Gallionella sp.]